MLSLLISLQTRQIWQMPNLHPLQRGANAGFAQACAANLEFAIYQIFQK